MKDANVIATKNRKHQMILLQYVCKATTAPKMAYVKEPIQTLHLKQVNLPLNQQLNS